MYKKKSQIITTVENLSNYVNGYDVYNALILEKISDPSIERKNYEITVYQYRPDLIAKDFYGSDKFLGLLMIQCGIGLSGYTKGTVLSLIPRTKIEEIIGSI